MILDVIQIILLLVCTGLLTFVCYHLTSHYTQPANLVKSENTPEVLPEPDLDAIREALIEYIDHESSILEFRKSSNLQYINYSCGNYDSFTIQLIIWIGKDMDVIATNLTIDKSFLKIFEKLKENQDKIKWLFPDEDVIYGLIPKTDVRRIGIQKHIDLTQRENWDEISVWVRENLEKLLYVIRIHDAVQESAVQKIEDDIPF